MKNLHLQTKMIIGFSVVLVLMAISSSLAFRQFVLVSENVQTYKIVVDGAAYAAKIEIQFLKLKSEIQAFNDSGGTGSAEGVQNIGRTLLDQLTSLPKAVRAGKDQARLEQIRLYVETFLDDFNNIQGLQKDMNGLVETRMLPEGEKITTDLDRVFQSLLAEGNVEASLHAEAALKHAYNARLFARSLVGHNDLSLGDRVAEEFAALHEAIKALKSNLGTTGDLNGQADAIDQLAYSYEQTLQQALESQASISSLWLGEMTRISDDLVIDTEALQKEALIRETQVQEETAENIQLGEIEIVIAGVLCFALGIVTALVLARVISRPVIAITDVMGELAQDNLSVTIPYTEQKDELGQMAKSVSHFKDQLERVRRLEEEQEIQKMQAEAQRRVAMMKMADLFEERVGEVVNAVGTSMTELSASATQLAKTAQSTSEQATNVSSSTAEASANVQTVAAAAEELTSSNDEIGRSVQKSSSVAGEASLQSQKTLGDVRLMMDEVDKISSFANLIRDIADQTNMLALNATIESERAGEAGAGFAVVAREVKSLATQTADATESIVGQITKVNNATHTAAMSIQEIESAITETDRITSSVAAAVEEQVVATHEIARSVEQAAQGTQQVAESIVTVDQASQETGSAATQIKAVTEELACQTDKLKTEVNGFLDEIRSGNDQKSIIEWCDDMETGVPMLDNDHRMMVDALNHYYGQMMSGVSQETLEKTITKALMTFERHIHAEEREMRKTGFPDLERHALHHREMFEQLKRLHAQAMDGDDISIEFFDTFAGWVKDHIEDDLDFARHIRDSHPEFLKEGVAA